MTKNKKLLLGAFGVIALGSYLVYRFFSKNKKGENLSYGESVKQDVQSAVGSVKEIALPVAPYPLKKGSTGSNVITLQKWLNDKGYASPKLVPDGSFGTKTENAVKSMQETPYEKNILDYIKKAMFSDNYSYGEVSKDFYDIFVVKTKTISNSGGLF
jgi:lysozyme family protein